MMRLYSLFISLDNEFKHSFTYIYSLSFQSVFSVLGSFHHHFYYIILTRFPMNLVILTSLYRCSITNWGQRTLAPDYTLVLTD